MPDSNHKYSLRQEARPIPYWKHHKRAKEALEFIIRGLEAAVNSVEAGKDDDKHFVDTNRASRIIFVSGEPGSGKSSLYLTLKETLTSPRDDEYTKGIKVPEGVEKVRWLDALDLEVASEEGENLLAAVLVRLINELTREDRVSKTIHSQPCDNAIKELEELATDIGIAWEGNLRARAGELDPDTYSEEVMRAQRARLGINDRLRKALDELAKNECYGCHKKTLFVLPVDDLYLKPDVSLQLLRLLRMISIPRLFFLIMGDIKTVEALFIEKSLADWTGVAGARLFAWSPKRLDAAITRARELRARYLRKLLPPLQRTMIEPMDWHEALHFESGGLSSSDDSLEKLLREVKLDTPYRTEEETPTLLDFLISPCICGAESLEEREKRRMRAQGVENVEPESKEERELKKIRSAYTALQILDATPREMMDLGAALREVIRMTKARKVADDKTPLLLTTVRGIVNLVREEQSFLNEKAQEVLENILPTREYGYPEDIIFEIDRLCLHPSQRNWKEEKSSAGSIWIRDHRSWNLTVTPDLSNGLDNPAKDQFAKLPPRPAAWFILLHDLAWEWNHHSLTVNLVGRMCEELNAWQLLTSKITTSTNQETCLQSKQRSNPKAEPKLDPSSYLLGGWAIWVDGSMYKHFPVPDFKLFRDIDRFLFIWSRGLGWLEEQQELADQTSKIAAASDEKTGAARKLVEEASARAEDVNGESETEAVTAQEQADASAMQKEAEAATVRPQADEAQERAGTDESQQISKLIRLWGLAGSTILNEQYDEFKPNDSNWFVQGLRDFATGIDKTQVGKNWRKKMGDFHSEVIPK